MGGGRAGKGKAAATANRSTIAGETSLVGTVGGTWPNQTEPFVSPHSPTAPRRKPQVSGGDAASAERQKGQRSFEGHSEEKGKQKNACATRPLVERGYVYDWRLGALSKFPPLTLPLRFLRDREREKSSVFVRITSSLKPSGTFFFFLTRFKDVRQLREVEFQCSFSPPNMKNDVRSSSSYRCVCVISSGAGTGPR